MSGPLHDDPKRESNSLDGKHSHPSHHDKSSHPDTEKLHPSDSDLSWAERDVLDAETASGKYGRFFKRNPSGAFTGDVDRMNTYELDPKRLKKIERKLDRLIIPSLAVCYAVSGFRWYVGFERGDLCNCLQFYYIDKTTLSYAAIFGST